MTNMDKTELRIYCQEGRSFDEIRQIVDCADATIRRYMRVLSPKPAEPVENTSNTLKTQLKTSSVTICQNCYCSTHTIDGKCGKCGVDKSEPVVSDELREQILAIDTVYRVGKAETTQFLLPEFYLDRLVDFVTHYADKRAIEELSKVKLDYGPYQAETFAGGKRQSLPDRIEQLKKGLQQRGKV